MNENEKHTCMQQSFYGGLFDQLQMHFTIDNDGMVFAKETSCYAHKAMPTK